MDKRPIGVFDSGLGGLTVVKQIIKTIPHESIIYLGDTARVPYGTRDKDTITKFALELTKYLLKHDVKYLVIACNTISATCLEEIESLSPVPVIGVIKPAAKLAAETTKNKKVGVIGTRATVSSGAYTREMRKIKESIQVFAEPCPLFVPIIEEGLMNHVIAEIAVKEYLLPFNNVNLDTLILGCTHYPMLRELIKKKMGSNVKLIDSAKPTAESLKEDLKEKGLLNEGEPEYKQSLNFSQSSKYKIYLTDTPLIAKSVINIFFEGDPPAQARKIDL